MQFNGGKIAIVFAVAVAATAGALHLRPSTAADDRATHPPGPPRYRIVALGTLLQKEGPSAGNSGGVPGQSEAFAINQRGQVVGESTGATLRFQTLATHASLWENGRLVDLGTLPGGGDSHAFAINNRGQVVGQSSVQVGGPGGHYETHAFLWQDGQMRDLDTLGGSQSAALAIDNQGDAAGYSESGAYPVPWDGVGEPPPRHDLDGEEWHDSARDGPR